MRRRAGSRCLCRNGWIVPLAMQDAMELHYFPSLGGEFFLWEPDKNENSAVSRGAGGRLCARRDRDAGFADLRMDDLHHTKAAHEVAEDATVYQRVAQRALLRPGTWWHDAAKNNLHVMVRAEAGSDRIVNISF